MCLTDDGMFSFSSFLPILYCYLRENFFFLHSLDLRSIENVPFVRFFFPFTICLSFALRLARTSHPTRFTHSFIIQPPIPHDTAEHRIPFLVG